jgi:hypothetical protein
MLFTTPISIPSQPFDISYQDVLMLIGSCFAEEVGNKLFDAKFAVDVNPFGTLYNPASVATSLRRLMQPLPFTADELFEHEGVYHSFAHHSRFSASSSRKAIEMMNNRLQTSSAHLKRATRLLITWGSAFVYRLKSTGQTVSNCHKFPDAFFVREQLSVDTIVDDWEYLIKDILSFNPVFKLVFTISPIRHWKDGAHGSQLSKSILLLAADRLQQAYPDRIAYFPAYELMMDELRDYRFYASDMLHPSPTAVDYIWERFQGAFFTPDTRTLFTAWQEVQKAMQHRPSHPESEAYLRFIDQTLLKAEDICKKFPYFDTEKEISRLKLNLE